MTQNSTAGSSRQPADKPVPRTVVEKVDWLTRHEAIVARARNGRVDLCFVGDSITEWWEGEKASKVWDECFSGWTSLNCGVGGDCTQHVLWRLRHGGIDGAEPRVIVLLIGTNNADVDNPARYTPEEVVEGISAIVSEIRKQSPLTMILLMGILPRGIEADAPIRRKIRDINVLVAKLDDGRTIRHLDIGERFLNKDGTLNMDLFWDPVHINDRGYRVWADAIGRTLTECLGLSTVKHSV